MLFEGFEWYDFVAIYVFSHVLSTLLLITLFGGNIISGILLVAAWEGWKAYERFRAK